MTESEEREENNDTIYDAPNSNGRKYIMFVCKKCGALCMTLPEYFLSTNPGDVIDNHLSHKISLSVNPNLLDEKDDNDQKDDIQIIQDNIFQDGLKVFLQLSESPFFPWCLACTMELEDRVQSRVKYLKDAESFYSQLDIPDKSIFQETLADEVARINTETSLMNQSNSSDDQLNSDSFSLNIESCSDLIEPQDNILNQRIREEINPQALLFRSLVLPTVFHIRVKGTYATINSLRLGQNKNWSISNDELDKSFYFLSLLIKNIGRLANVDVSSIQVSTEVKIKISTNSDEANQASRKSDFISKISESLFGKGTDNDTILLKASDMRRGRTIDRFNQALDVIFKLSSQIFETQGTIPDSAMPPNYISPEDHTIADRCYYFDPKEPYEWSHNMRLLLFNYAFMFTFCLRNAVLSLE